jgi:hypothetical protein
VVHVTSDADGEPNFFWWDGGAEASNANGTDVIASNISEFANGGTNEGVWRRVRLPFSAATTDDLGEGSTNEYYTDEKAQDAVGSALGSQFAYDDGANLISLNQGDGSGLTADTLDGIDSTEFAQLAQDETITGNYTFDGSVTLGTNSGLDAGGNAITNVADPTNPQDVATKNFVEALEQGLDLKDSVRAATDGQNIDLGSATDPNPVDGVTLNDGDRVLLKDQLTGSENGIYVANTATDPSTWTRSADFDEDAEATDGSFAFVEEGTSNANKGYVLTTENATLGSTALNFTQFSGAGQIQAGNLLTKSGDTLNVNDDLSLYDNSTSGFISDLSGFDTDDLSEGTGNLYFTDERAQDAVGTVTTGGTDITVNYDDGGNTLTINHAATGGASDLTGTSQFVNGLTFDGQGHVESVSATSVVESLNGGTDITVSGATGDVTIDHANTGTASSTGNTGGTVLQTLSADDRGHVETLSTTTLDTDDISEGTGNLYFTDERAQDAVGTIIQGGTGATVNYDDQNNTITITGTSSLTQEEVQDFAFGTDGVLTGTQTLISVTYDDANDAVDYVVENDLSQYDNSTSAFIDGVGGLNGGTSLGSSFTDLDFGTGLTATDAGSGELEITNDVRFGSDSLTATQGQTQFDIPHGLSSAPSSFVVQATNDNASGISHVQADSTNLTVFYDTPPKRNQGQGTVTLNINFALEV